MATRYRKKTKPGRKNKIPATEEDSDDLEDDELILDFPKTSDEFETAVSIIWEQAANAEARRFWDFLTLLRDKNKFDNSVLLRLVNFSKSPYEIWRAEQTKSNKSFRDIQKSIEIAMNVISDVTKGDDPTNHRRGSIALRNKDDYLYVAIRDHLSNANEKKEKFLIGDSNHECGIAGYVAFTKKSLRVPNVTDDPRFISFQTTPSYKSLLCVPIMVDDNVFGTFSIDSRTEDAYTQEEEELANLFAYSIATSLTVLFIRHTRHF